MKYVVVEVACQSCSFRNPDFQNFHKTYDLPPPTTLMGMAGAALGLSPKAAQAYFTEGCEFGVAGSCRGKSNDLWKYRKLKGKEFITDILTREVMFEGRYVLVYGSDDPSKIERLREAFEQPVYALTLGNSDGLVKVQCTSIISETIVCEKLKNCIVAGNLLQEVLTQSSGLEFELHDGTDPMSYEVPVQFSYESDYGVRRVVRRKELSFIGPSLFVKGLAKKGIQYKDYQIPLFTLHAE